MIHRIALLLLSFLLYSLYGGQNASAFIGFDLDLSAGYQGVHSAVVDAANQDVWVEVHIIDCSNLDTYEFDLSFPATDLSFQGGYEDNLFSAENNILKQEGTTIGFGATDEGGVVNVRNTLVGNQGDASPDGTGLLALLKFKSLVAHPGGLHFLNVYVYDNDGVRDTPQSKGDASLPVELGIFKAKVQNEGILLTWVTESEINVLGYNVWRAVGKEKMDYIPLCSKLIPANGYSQSPLEYNYFDQRVEHGQQYSYKLECIDLDGSCEFHGPVTIGYFTANSSLQEYSFNLCQNFPNPFNPFTTIEFTVKEQCQVSLDVYNVRGRKIATLVDESMSAGQYAVEFDAMNLPSGLYFCKIQMGEYSDIKKMVLNK
ncbi:T9SS type A sorting domain-containing protein [candidate division KSB1 bacterium]|nr:T9SS type A sorting domain-containing protein [candidate division KSB1 bacterium]